ncbi:MAG: phosphoribosylglycinamide formyltransferase [Bacillus sp. (in: firmicutes)]
MRKIAVFASGSGSNFQSIQDHITSGKLDAVIAIVICDRPGALVIERANREGIPVFSFNAKDYGSKAEFEALIVEKLRDKEVEFIVLAGYMRLIGETLLRAYPNSIINIHPSLLPSFPGKDAIGQAFSAGVKVTGVTIHYVDEGMDTGPVIAQRAVDVRADDTREILQKRIQETEHVLYPLVLHQLLSQHQGRATERKPLEKGDKKERHTWQNEL